MYTIKDNLENTLIIKKSKFIAKVFYIENIEQEKNIILELKEKYSDATHICYSYICGNDIKFSDDNEPSNTAGMPIYNVLKNNNLNYVLLVVIRYFGGIKLGAGGLTRAYSQAASKVIKNNICTLKEGFKIEIEFNYNNLKEIKYILKDLTIINEDYEENVKITFLVLEENINEIKEKLKNFVISFRMLKETLIKSNN